MKVNYYAHVVYYNPLIYSFEYIIETDKMNVFISEIFSVIQGNYEEIYGSEDFNFIDIFGWIDFLEENKINFNCDDYFPYETIWNFINVNIENIFNSKEKDDFKYDSVTKLVQTYLEMVSDANFNKGKYLFEINLFRDSQDFAKYFFPYFNSMYDYIEFPSYLKDRISTLNNLTEKYNFPNSDYHEGILGEWILIFNSICSKVQG